MDRLAAMEAFVRVVDAGSFSGTGNCVRSQIFLFSKHSTAIARPEQRSPCASRPTED
jgi:hypothetical protein